MCVCLLVPTGDLIAGLVGRACVCLLDPTGNLLSDLVGRVCVCLLVPTGDLIAGLVGRVCVCLLVLICGWSSLLYFYVFSIPVHTLQLLSYNYVIGFEKIVDPFMVKFSQRIKNNIYSVLNFIPKQVRL